MAVKKARYDQNGKLIGYHIFEGNTKEFQPVENFERLKNLSANADFDGVAYRFKQESKTPDELIREQNQLLDTLKKLSSYQGMSSKKKHELIAIARKAFNRFQTYADTVFLPNQVEGMQDRFDEFAANLQRYTTIRKKWQPLDLAAYRQTLGASKSADLAENLKRCLFNYTQRITLFDLYGKGQLEEELLKQALGNRGSGMDYHKQLDELMAMLDREFPTGYLKVPVVTVSEKYGVKVKKQSSRRMALDYYLQTWIEDVNATFDNAVMENAYMQAGIDLIIMRNEGEGACSLCGPDTGKIFSLTGKDPDFPIAPYRPAHPHCDCYPEPLMTKEFWRKNPLSEEQAAAFREGFKRDREAYRAETASKRADEKNRMRPLEDEPTVLSAGIEVTPEDREVLDALDSFGNPNYGMPKNKQQAPEEEEADEHPTISEEKAIEEADELAMEQNAYPEKERIDNLLQINVPNDKIEYINIIRNAIADGTLPLSIVTRQQDKHREETRDPKLGKSIFRLDPEAFVLEYAGTGKLQFDKKGVWQKKEMVLSNAGSVGTWVIHQQLIESDVAVIVYSKSGTHVFPVNPRKWKWRKK